MALRWRLAHTMHSVTGQDVRGLVPWDHYVQLRDTEAGPSLFLSLFFLSHLVASIHLHPIPLFHLSPQPRTPHPVHPARPVRSPHPHDRQRRNVMSVDTKSR